MSAQVKDKEAFQRLSFLYQAAHCVLAQNPENQALARFYCHAQRSISRRLVLRQDPSVKRTICKSCSSLLVPGISSTVRQRRHRGRRWSVIRCLCCGQTKRFPSNPGYKLWAEQPEALLENQPQADQKPAAPQDSPKEPSAQKAKTRSVASGLESRPTPQGTAEAGTRVGKGGPSRR
ncbi:ribonuclease P protein subunit p21 [Dermochelys coriacea]|uniref:ribonuclease P protein subunit p21 n=1 Tax=Dermochelys coriacea TaxID=27794 RepID=UPI0018E7F4A8|nr:ribonuclease P protein subunit p21 [Dermochelys coriacea]XP_043353080.1 ribonuclease P protein subunit p21 [Dermochelys coriacea]